MKDWKQEIAETVRRQCDHGPPSMIVGVGCPRCQALFTEIMLILNEALDGLIRDTQRDACPTGIIEGFKRSIPS